MRRPALLALALLAHGCFSTVGLPSVQSQLPPPTPGSFPHDTLNALVRTHVDSEGRVNYAALRQDLQPLLQYLDVVARFSPRTDPELFPTEADALTYWINGYNAYVLYAVASQPELQSVNDDKAKFFYFTKYRFGGEAHSLYAVENDIVRKNFEEPRIHFALNCASGGCPRLPQEAFQSDRLESQLARESTRFCADPSKVQLKDGVVLMSQIFEWYAKDFEADGGAIEFCRKWGRSDLPASAELRFIPYDWALNAQPAPSLSFRR